MNIARFYQNVTLFSAGSRCRVEGEGRRARIVRKVNNSV